MLLRNLLICCYLVSIYWLSLHLPSLKMVFYPTLGAFCFLAVSRGRKLRDTGIVMVGAIVSVTLGSLLYSISSGALSFFATALVTITLIQAFKWNAAPILAVSFIPYFAHPDSIWTLPLSVVVSLSGLFLLMWAVGSLEKWLWMRKLSVSVKLLRRKVVRQLSAS